MFRRAALRCLRDPFSPNLRSTVAICATPAPAGVTCPDPLPAGGKVSERPSPSVPPLLQQAGLISPCLPYGEHALGWCAGAMLLGRAGCRLPAPRLRLLLVAGELRLGIDGGARRQGKRGPLWAAWSVDTRGGRSRDRGLEGGCHVKHGSGAGPFSVRFGKIPQTTTTAIGAHSDPLADRRIGRSRFWSLQNDEPDDEPITTPTTNEHGSGIRPERPESHRISPISVGPEIILNQSEKFGPV
jgi:hypothetical protein